MENVNLNAAIETAANEAVNSVREALGYTPATLKDTTFMGDKANVIGGVIGTLAAVGVELMSETGNVYSASAALATGVVLLGSSYKELADHENTYGTAAITGGINFGLGFIVGRTVAKYTQPAVEADSETEYVQLVEIPVE